MATIKHTIYVNADSNDPRSSIVWGPSNLSPKAAPRVVLGDVLNLEVYFLNSDGTYHDASGNANWNVQAAIGNYSAGVCAIANNFLPTGSAFTGSMLCNTIELARLLNSASYADAIFEIQLTDLVNQSGSRYSPVTAPIVVSNQLIDGSFLSSGSLALYLSITESDARYVLRNDLLSASGWFPIGSTIVWTNRKVGIGTNNPSEDLHVVGDGLFTGAVTASNFTGSLYGKLLGSSSYSDNAAGWIKSGSITYTLQDQIGIGTTQPTAAYAAQFALVAPSASSNGRFAMDSPYGNTELFLAASSSVYFSFLKGISATARIFSDYEDFSIKSLATNTGSIRFFTNSQSLDVERMRIVNNGSVGIGTKTPATGIKLHVQGAISSSAVTASLYGTSSWSSNNLSSSYSLSSSYAVTASYCSMISASFAIFASQSGFAQSSSYALTASYFASGSITNVYVVSNSFASQSISASHANMSDTASAAFFGVGGFDARGGVTASSIQSLVYIRAPAGNTALTFGSSSVNVFGQLNLQQSVPIVWSGFPNLYLKPIISPSPDYGWLWLYQSSFTASVSRFNGLKVSGDVWANNLTASFLQGTASWALNAISTSYYQITGSVVNLISASWASSSISASYALRALSASWAPGSNPSGLETGSTYPFTSSWAVSASWAPAVAATQFGLETGSTYPITASWSNNTISASYALSASWARRSVTASVVDWLFNHNQTYLGYSSVRGQQGYTTAIGYQAGQTSIINSGMTAIGAFAGQNAVSASSATLLGYAAGYNAYLPIEAVMIGYNCGYNAYTSSYSVLIGSNADAVYDQRVTKSIAIGYKAVVSASNTCVIGGRGADAVKVVLGGGTTAVNTLDVIGNISASVVTASLFYGTASFAVSASWAPNGAVASGLATGSTYPITSSWALNSISTSYWDSSSVATRIDTLYTNKQNNLATGSTIPVTSSWANNSISSSYWDSSSIATILNNKQWNIATGSSLPVTSSWSSNAISSSYWDSSSIATILNNKQWNIATGSTLPITASWSNNSISSSYWDSSSVAVRIDTLYTNKQNNLATGSTIPITASWAVSASWAPSATPNWLNTGSSYPITSSWSVNSVSSSYWDSSSVATRIDTLYSNKQNNLATGSLVPVTASWSNNSISSSYWDSSSIATILNNKQWNISTGSTLPVTSSWALNVVNAPFQAGTMSTGSSYPITSSWAANVQDQFKTSSIMNTTSSYVALVSNSTGSYFGVVFEVAARSGSNSRQSTISAHWYSSSFYFTEVGPSDIGSTLNLTMSVGLKENGLVQLSASADTSPWQFRIIGRYI